MFSTLSIRTRLAGTLSFLGAMLVAIGLLGQIGMQQENDALQKAYTDTLDSTISLGKTTLNLAIVRTTLDRVLLHPDSPDVGALIVKAQDYPATSQKAWQHYKVLPKSPEEQQLADAVEQARQTFLDQAILPMIDDMKQGKHEEADHLAMKVVPPLSVQLTKRPDALDEYQTRSGEESYTSAQQRFHLFRLISWIGIAIAIAIAAGLACARNLQRAIARPIADALAHFAQISSGDLPARIEVRSNDEMGQLIGGLATMRRKLTDTVQQVSASAASIGTATGEIAAGNTDLSQRTEEQAASLEETAASMEQLTATVKQNADNARQARQLADNASGIAAEGAHVVEQVIGTMGQIDASSQKIADIIGVIEGIAFQTNILARNAAVEAARAGEQGRGFAVVAGETAAAASLAEQTAVLNEAVSVFRIAEPARATSAPVRAWDGVSRHGNALGTLPA